MIIRTLFCTSGEMRPVTEHRMLRYALKLETRQCDFNVNTVVSIYAPRVQGEMSM